MDYDALDRALRGGKCPRCKGWGEVAYAGEMVSCGCNGKYAAPISMANRIKAADAIADLRARNDALCDIIFRYVDPCDVLPEDDAVVAGAIAANREG